MRPSFLLYLLLFSVVAYGQKKVTPVTRSGLAGVSLPEGSTQDKRLLSTSAARMLLEMEAKQDGFSIGEVEVLYLPTVSKSNFGADSLVAAFSAAGWSMQGIDRDDKYLWLVKGATTVLVYFEMQAKETQLYFGKASGGTGVNTNTGGDYGAAPSSNTNPPIQQQENTPPPSPPSQQYSNPPPPPPGNMEQVQPSAAGSSGIVISTINFDDGWTSVPQEDWVLVTKGANKTYLHFAIALPEELRSGSGEPILEYFWNRLIAPRYRTGQIERRPFDPYDYKRLYFQEADATDPNTGSQVHVGLRIVINSGIASCIELVTPTRNDLYTLFPDITKTDQMLFYNRFAIHPSDLVGEWDESSGNFVQYYNVYTGANMGMNAVSVNSHMSMGADGRYVLEHKGASGMVGNQQFFQEKYTGKYQVTNWTLSVVDQNGKETRYHAYYQAVKGGRILQLQNQQYSGSTMALVKVR